MKYIDEKFRATGEGTLNHDLKMYLDLSEFEPLFDGSVEIVRGESNGHASLSHVFKRHI